MATAAQTNKHMLTKHHSKPNAAAKKQLHTTAYLGMHGDDGINAASCQPTDCPSDRQSANHQHPYCCWAKLAVPTQRQTLHPHLLLLLLGHLACLENLACLLLLLLLPLQRQVHQVARLAAPCLAEVAAACA
jgi:hypothetical protein